MNNLSLFVLGLPRSGTKLLRELLNNHEEIFIPSIEAYFIPHLIEKHSDKRLSKQEVLKAVKEIKNSLFFFYYKKRGSFNFKKFISEDITVKELIGNIWQELALKKYNRKMRILGDKTPRNVNRVQFILKSFPEAKIIHIVRDPRDNVLSAKNKWGKNIFRAAYKWQKGINKVMKVNEGKERLFQVKYEQLLTNTDEVLRKICNFIDINYIEGMDKLHTKVEQRGGRIDRKNYDKYLNELEVNEIKYIEKLTKKGLEEYNYKLNYEDAEFVASPPLLKILLWQIQDVANLITYNIKVHGFLKGIEKIKKARKHV